MKYLLLYRSPLGEIKITSDGEAVTSLALEGQTGYIGGEPDALFTAADVKQPELDAAARWLDEYFNGIVPDVRVPLSLNGSPFATELWRMLTEIPYGETATYGGLAVSYAAAHGMIKMSARAVGHAVGSNPVSIIVPCHRVIRSDGSVGGYNGGVRYKEYLLELERRARQK